MKTATNQTNQGAGVEPITQVQLVGSPPLSPLTKIWGAFICLLEFFGYKPRKEKYQPLLIEFKQWQQFGLMQRHFSSRYPILLKELVINPNCPRWVRKKVSQIKNF